MLLRNNRKHAGLPHPLEIMVMSDFAQRTKELLRAIPDISELTMSPSIFSDDTEKHDCDECPAFANNAGDLFDPDVCQDCWERAIDSCKS